MTHFYTYRGFSLRRAALSTKILITSFFAVVSLAFLVGVVNYGVRTGLGPAGAAVWYVGNEESAGPGEGLLYEKTPLELLDATHPHLFGQAFLFFVLCHLFALVPVRQSLKLLVFATAYISVLLDAALPWLIRYASPQFGILHPLVAVAMLSALLTLVLVPLREMWFPSRGAGRLDDVQL